MRVVINEKAWDDLNSIGAWIAKDNPQAARHVLEHILRVVNQLESLPRLGHKGRAPGTYERGVSGTPYIIVYKISDTPAAVLVGAIVHGARDR